MNATTNYHLNQWAKSDQVRMEDFNADNAKIDAALSVASFGNCRIAVGSYTGTGQFGASHPNTLTFDFYPKIIFLDTHANHSAATSLDYLILLEGLNQFGLVNDACITTWNGKTVSWYSRIAKPQFNTLDQAYHYIALGTAED